MNQTGPEPFFTKHAPDFVNYRGQIISASKQVDALGQAQGIGENCEPHPHKNNAYDTRIVYLSIFITQCFNVRFFTFLGRISSQRCLGVGITRCSPSRPDSRFHSAGVSLVTNTTSLAYSLAPCSACSSCIPRRCTLSLDARIACCPCTGSFLSRSAHCSWCGRLSA